MKPYRIEAEQEIISKTGIEFFYYPFKDQKKSISPHIHSAVELLFIQKGKFQIFADDEEIFAEEGCTVLFRSNTIHRIFCHSEGEAGYYVLKFSPSLILSLADPESRSRYLMCLGLHTKGGRLLWSAEESARVGLLDGLHVLLRETEQTAVGFDIARKIGAATVLLSLLRALLPSEDQSSVDGLVGEEMARRIYAVTVYLHEHYAEPITASDCAAMAFASASYFSRCFFRVTGRTFKEYLNLTRVNHAEKAILGSDRSVTEIASNCGFNSVSYFISTYKKLRGITPLALRNGKNT